MKPVCKEPKLPTARAAALAGKGRFRTRLGGRLLSATSTALIRLVERIERTFRLPPEAAENALKRFADQTGVKPAPLRSTPLVVRPERRKTTHSV